MIKVIASVTICIEIDEKHESYKHSDTTEIIERAMGGTLIDIENSFPEYKKAKVSLFEYEHLLKGHVDVS